MCATASELMCLQYVSNAVSTVCRLHTNERTALRPNQTNHSAESTLPKQATTIFSRPKHALMRRTDDVTIFCCTGEIRRTRYDA
jgi:hypothetical protein